MENQSTLNVFSVAAGDGAVNGTSMPMDNIWRVRILVHGNGAGEPGSLRMIINHIPPEVVNIGVTIREYNIMIY